MHDQCGIVVCHSLHDTYSALKAIQHRGQDTTGIAAKNRYGIDILRWHGEVRGFSLENIHKILTGNVFIGHVRYATYGEKGTDALFGGAHPRFLGTEKITEYPRPPHPHMIARGATRAIVHNGTLVGVSVDEGIDTDLMLKLYETKGIEWVMETFPASYSAAILDMQSDDVILFRDRYGIRPLFIGEKDGRVVAASEDVAIWDIGGRPIREVRPGEIIHISQEGKNFRSKQIISQFGLFATVALIGLGLNQLILYILVEFAKLWYMFAKFIAIFIVMFWSFYGHKKLTFNVFR